MVLITAIVILNKVYGTKAQGHLLDKAQACDTIQRDKANQKSSI
jgi:hypothetical protein